ncbi:MAG: tetratricopeptide repeat protein [Candidatus Obscuribacterales bacterium]|nr:tetratricopeptide repeat protein [Candidatus Obscuribacterales bacterium]
MFAIRPLGSDRGRNRTLIAAGLIFALNLLISHSSSAEPAQSAELKELLRRIDVLCDRNDFERAAPIADVAVKKFPDSYDAHLRRGYVYVGLDEEEKGIEDYFWALKRRPKDAKLAHNLSNAYFKLDKLDLALKYIDEALANDVSQANRASYFMLKRDILKSAHRYKEAQVANTEAVKRISVPHWYLERLKLAGINGDWKTVLSDSERLLPIMPKFRSSIIRLRAQALIGSKRFAEAEKILTETIKITPDNRDLLMERSKLYAALGKKDLAEKDLQSVKRLDESL